MKQIHVENPVQKKKVPTFKKLQIITHNLSTFVSNDEKDGLHTKGNSSETETPHG